MSNKIKITDGKLYIYCEELKDWLPKFKTENEIRWELDEKHFVYLLEGHSVDESRKTDYIYKALCNYNFSPYYGPVRKSYLEKEKYNLYLELENNDSLQRHLVETDIRACELENRLVEQLAEAEGVTDELKEEDLSEWILKMSSIIRRARETVQNELIFI